MLMVTEQITIILQGAISESSIISTIGPQMDKYSQFTAIVLVPILFQLSFDDPLNFKSLMPAQPVRVAMFRSIILRGKTMDKTIFTRR